MWFSTILARNLLTSRLHKQPGPHRSHLSRESLLCRLRPIRANAGIVFNRVFNMSVQRPSPFLIFSQGSDIARFLTLLLCAK